MTIRKTLTTAIIFAISILLLNSCDNTYGPVVNNDTVPQTDILWPSLADSPWPMHHHDPQSTGRSKYHGPQYGVISKKVYVGISESGISIGNKKTIYISTSYSPYDFMALDYEGNIKWKISHFLSLSTPIIGNKNIIYAPGVRSILSLKEDGDTLWQKILNNNNKESITNVGMNIDKEGNLYFIDASSSLSVIDSKSQQLWKLQDARFLNNENGAPSFSPDGNTLYIQGKAVSVLAVDINKRNIKWTFGNERLDSSPVIDNEGNLYFIPGSAIKPNGKDRILYSLNHKGNIRWKYNFNALEILDNTEPTIDYHGNIYFGADTLYSLTNDGKLRWKKSLDSNMVVSPLVCDSDNIIYIGTVHLYKKINTIFAFTSTGNLKWKIEDLEERLLGVSPALAEDGILFYPTWDNEKGNYLIIK